MVTSKLVRNISIMVLVFFVHWAHAALIGKGPTAATGDLYPYTQTIIDATDSFDVEMDGKLAADPNTHLYVSVFQDTIGIMKSPDAPTNSIGDYRQINADEEIHLTFSNIPSGKQVEISALSGYGPYFPLGRELVLSKNGQLVETIFCDGSGSYSIFPPIQATNGDTVSLNPSGNIRLYNFTANLTNNSSSNEPYISDSTPTSTLLDQTLSEPGHYYVTADWSGLTHKPNGVVAKVFNGSSEVTLYFLGATGPDTSAVDFDLLVLNPGDTVQVLAGLTGDAGEDPGLWSVSLDRYDSWAGSRYSVPTVPLGLASPPSSLDIHQNAWPKNSGFRNDYRGIKGEDNFNNYVNEALGHAPKCYAEELVSSWKNQVLMDSYAQSHPEWQAMVHWNGKTIKLYYDVLPEKLAEFKPYHFRFKVGSYLSSAINATETQITVDDAGNFTVDTDAIIIPVDPTTGQRQFEGSELVYVSAISGNQLTVIRHAYDDKISNASSAFAAGSYIAPGSQGAGGGSRYNYALNAPVDGQGRNGADMVAEMLSHEFAPGNVLERFHGIMFDVLPGSAGSSDDCDLDGFIDEGMDPRGIDLFRLGVQAFGRKLRAALPERILTFDGQDDHWPALQTVFNGIEAEGFSRYNDSYTKRWSKSLNYYRFTERWNQSSNFYSFCTPKQNDDPPEAESRALRRFHMAGLVAMGVALSHKTVDDGSGTLHALDEIRNGTEGTLQWLGAPVSELIRPGLSAPDQLGGAGLPAAGWVSPNGSATVSNGAEGILVEPVDTGIDHEMIVEFSGISIPSGDLLIRFEGKGGVPHLPSDTARYINVEVDGRVSNGLTYDTLTGVVNNDGFTEVTAYFRSAGAAGGSTVTLRLIIEAAADLALRNFTIHNATDTLLREFENGIVLCNPSENPYTFDLASTFPGKSFVRIQGQSYDDPVTNDGSQVGDTVQLAGYRGLFLRRVLPPCGDPPGDFNDDCVVNLMDLEMMAANWLQAAFPGSQIDSTGDGNINFEDFSGLSENWLQEF